MIKFNNEKTNKQVFEKIRDHTKSFNLEQLVNDSRADLFYMDDAIRTLYFATITGQNAILYGPGGYGKSRVVKYFYQKLGIPVFTKVCNSSTTVEDLLGIPDMQKLMNDSEYVTAFSKTIFKNKGILFLEEGLDMQPDVASALKDVLTTKGYHQGNSIDPSFISSVVIATNKNPQECALDDSTAAFYEERFPHVIKIDWASHTYTDYYEFLTHSEKTNNIDDDIIKLLASVYEENEVSPRKALYYAHVIKEMGIKYITNLSGLNTKSIEDMIERSKEKDTVAVFLDALENLKVSLTYPKEDDSKIRSIEHLISYILTLTCPEDLIDLRDTWILKSKLVIKNIKNVYTTSN